MAEFRDIVGQEQLKEHLQGAIERNKVSHAYIINGERKSMEEIDEILKERRKNWKPREPKYKKGVLRLFSEHAASPMKGAYLEY